MHNAASAPARPRSPTCAGLPRLPGRAGQHAPVCRARPAALADMRRSCRARPAALADMRRFAAPARPARRHTPVCRAYPAEPADMRRSCRARPAALADMRRFAAPARPARRHAPVLPRPPGRPANMRRFAAPARPARHNAPVSHTRPAAPRPPAGLCLSPWKAEKYAPAKYIYKRAAALQPGRSDCNGHFLETSLQIQLAVV